MDYVSAREELERLESDGEWGKVMQLSELLEAFPDLKLFRDHYGQIKYCSREANAEVDSIEMDSCHTCEGKPIKLWPFVYIDKQGTRLYSDPPLFVIADQNTKGFGEIPRAGWEEVLETAGISRSVMLKVKLHFSGHPPINYFED